MYERLMTYFPLSGVYMYDLGIDLSGVFFEYENYHVPVISYFKSKRST